MARSTNAAPSTTGDAQAQLARLLGQVSDDDGVRALVLKSLPVGVDWNALEASIADDVSRLPAGRTAAPFFEALAAAFPTRSAEIDAVATMWSGAATPPPQQRPQVVEQPWFRDRPLKFERSETRRAEAIITGAYGTKRGARRLAENAGVDPASLDEDGNLKDFIREILRDAARAGRLLQLIEAIFEDEGVAAFRQDLWPLVEGYERDLELQVLRDRPSIARLAAVPPSIDVLLPGAKAGPLRGQLQQLINADAGFADLHEFLLGLATADARTARISVGGRPSGTGFLVGDSLLLTNAHVVRTAHGAVDTIVEFDGRAAGSPSRRVRLAEADWRVCHSENRPLPEELGAAGPAPGAWDYALLRLAEPVGTQPLGPAANKVGLEARGCYRLIAERHTFTSEEPLLIVGHPKGVASKQLSYASPGGATTTASGARVRYLTNTEGGSSGSPVFDRAWQIVALHHAAGPTDSPGDLDTTDAAFNQGIPISHVVADLREKLGDRPPILEELGLA